MPVSQTTANPPHIIVATIMRRHGDTGIQTHINELATYVVEMGGILDVVTPFSYLWLLANPVFAVRRIIQPLSGPLSVWWYRTFHYIFLRMALFYKLRNEDRPVIYALCPLSAKAAILSRRNANQKVVLPVMFNRSQALEWELSGHIKSGDWVYQGIEQLEETTLPMVDGMVFLTDFMRHDLEQRIPSIQNVQSADIPLFTSTPKPGQCGYAMGDIISIGTLEPRKNQAYVLRVLSEARRMGFEYSLTLIGDGPDRSRLQDLVNELGLRDQVRFLGFQPNAARYIEAHRVYAHSAIMEGFGLVLIESMARGRPVLAAPVGGIPEVYSDGVEGYHWPLDDPEEGAKKLIGLLEDEASYRRVADAAKQRFEQDYSEYIVADRLVGFLADVRDAPPRRAIETG